MNFNDTNIYPALFKSANEDVVERSQHFNPFFSWVMVTFTYFTIGIRGGKVWKYLFYCSTAGVVATALSVTVTLSRKLDYNSSKIENLKYIEGPLWTLTEWGYTYINYIKVKSCIKSLRRPFWNIIMIIILIYSLSLRFYLSYLDKYENGLDKSYYERKKDTYHGLVFFPLGVVSLIFIYFIFKEFVEEKDKKNRNIINVLLHSTLTRMTFVSLIFIGLSFVVHISRSHYFWYFIRTFLWRLKGNLGIIFLLDMLLLRIDLDHNQLVAQQELIDQNNLEKSLSKHSEKDHQRFSKNESNKLSFNDFNFPNSAPPLLSSHHENEKEFEPNDFIQENIGSHISKSHSRHSINLSSMNINRPFNSMGDIGKDNYGSNLSYNKLLNENITNNLYNQYNNNTSSYNSQHFPYTSKNSSMYSSLNSPGVSSTKMNITPSPPNMIYTSPISVTHSSSNTIGSSDIIYSNMGINTNKAISSPMSVSINNNDMTFNKSSQSSSSNDELIYNNRPIKSPLRKYPGNILLDSTLT
ncbi:hypothetical protein LY90DRAFT_675901 [Neocallimastix californiae]|jgi:hypothetical protein|uniref:Uncharacterized protein n=1 Tax=Neocallimastix californiae TaxID=1754190 RepID=A0A1Y2AIE5_9FUNG|nr:hypothetical protein LY90DRAFT_675901 [Neocallimastix californiae]|eukprot:ORY22358.1 hypothetical protein LY90DRAFT_675901 [Neocallimastix californiae]